MIGFYNYSVILTYLGLASAIFGMSQAITGNINVALLCLIISGTCDMFDGKVARAMKNRTEDEKVFGIQIDSLCDLVCFGVLPGIIAYMTCPHKALGVVSATLFVLAAVIRLGYFNVMEQARQKETSECRKYYQGLPVTTISMILPSVYIIRHFIGIDRVPSTVYSIVLLIVAFLFVYDFKVKKPGNIGCLVMTVYGVCILAGVIFLK